MPRANQESWQWSGDSGQEAEGPKDERLRVERWESEKWKGAKVLKSAEGTLEDVATD